MKTPPIVSAQEWDAARQEMLVTEKEHTRARYALAAICRTSGAASYDTPVASGPRMISR